MWRASTPRPPRTGESTDALTRALRPFARRLRGQRALAWAGPALAAALAIAGIGWRFAGPGIGAALFIPLVAAIAGWFWPVAIGRAARFADQAAGLNAAADTALHLAGLGHPAAAAVAADAVDGLAGRAPPPLRWRGFARWLGAGAALALLLALPDLREEAPPPVDPHAETRQRLDDIEAKARREGQEQLVAAARALRLRLEDAWKREEELARSRPPEAPKPTPPPTPKTAPAETPPDGLSPEAWRAAMDEAQLRMSTDEAELRELTRLLEAQLVQITAFQDSADSLLFETMMLNGMENPLSDFQSRSAMNSAQMAQRGINQNEEFAQRGMGPALDMSNPAEMQRNEMDSAGHERTHALQQSYHDFLKAYAESMRDELMNAMKDVTEKKEEGGGSGGGDDGMDLSSNFSEASKSAQAGQGPTNLAERESGAESATASLAKLGEQGKRIDSGVSGAGSGESTEAGGKGAGAGPSGEGQQVNAPESANGSLEQLSGQFNPGTLDREEQLAALGRVSELAAATGAGSEFDEAWNGYFDEVERTLVEEDLPPMMEGMVRAYFADLREER